MLNPQREQDELVAAVEITTDRWIETNKTKDVYSVFLHWKRIEKGDEEKLCSRYHTHTYTNTHAH